MNDKCIVMHLGEDHAMIAFSIMLLDEYYKNVRTIYELKHYMHSID